MAATYKKSLRSSIDVINRTDSVLFARSDKYLNGIDGVLMKTPITNHKAAIKIDMDKIRGELFRQYPLDRLSRER